MLPALPPGARLARASRAAVARLPPADRRPALHPFDLPCWLPRCAALRHAAQDTLAATTDVAHNKAHPYTDGDQSIVPDADMPSQPNYRLREHWSQGFNFNPAMFGAWGAPLFTHCFVGDAAGVRELLQAAGTAEKKRRLVERRVSGLRMSPILTVICGCRDAQASRAYAPRGRVTGQYEECLQLLLEARARPTCRDVCGYSAIHHCTTCISSQRTWEMVPILVCYGANPNVRNRFDYNPLFESITARNLGAVKALALAGADPNQRYERSASCTLSSARPAPGKSFGTTTTTPFGLARKMFPEGAACLSKNAVRVRGRQAAVQGRRCTLRGESVSLLVTGL